MPDLFKRCSARDAKTPSRWLKRTLMKGCKLYTVDAEDCDKTEAIRLVVYV